uniref:Uncharacterized protein n=1 Tax=Acrobeloides nanus TaxID=290746 RepID=A0A914E7D8_9BILA
MFSNVSFPYGNYISIYTGGLDDTNSAISYCDVSNCNITQTPCIFTCSNIPYYGFTMSLLYYGEFESIYHTPFLIYGNMTYPVENFRMYTPDWEQDTMYEDIGELWQGCIEFDYISEVDSEDTCTNFTSNTLVYNGQQLLFNYSIHIYYHDPDKISITTEQKFNTTGYVILDTPNEDGP